MTDISNSLPDRTDVLIVGAGPTGLTLASVFAARGVPFVLVDRLAEGANTSRAAVVHARTLEVLDEIGVTQRLIAAGHVVRRFSFRDRDRALVPIRFDDLPSPYRHLLMIPQCTTERILLERLRELGGDVHRPFTVEEVGQDADGAWIAGTGADGARRTVRARYLVGADGMNSLVREGAGIGFTGGRYAQSFILADVRLEWSLGNDEVLLFLAPDGLVVIAPLPDGRHRVVATVDEAPEHPTLADVQAILDARGPASSPTVASDLSWSTRFRVHHRVADRYRAGRILLAGDAAHVHSPAGGQGMNTGIQDAAALGEALARVVADAGAEAALDAYEAKRRPIARRVVAFTDRMTRMATLRSRPARKVRNFVLSLVGRVGAVRRRLAIELAELRYR